ncbi:MAG: hypothetical protein ACK56I_23345, partial [bacterium]
VVGHLHATLHKHRLVDGVHLGDGLDDGGVDGLGAAQDGGHLDGQVGGGRLVDGGGVAGHVGCLAQVNLLGDDGGGLVDGGHAGGLGVHRVGGGHRHSGRGGGQGRSAPGGQGCARPPGVGQGSRRSQVRGSAVGAAQEEGQ